MQPEPAPVAAWGPIESTRLATADGEQLGAWLVRRPTSKTVGLLLHGYTSRRTWWLPIMGDLADRGVSVMAISFRAHGDSTGQLNDVGYSARLDVEEAVKFLQAQLPGQRIVVVGSSMGAAAALFAAKDLGTTVSGYFFESPYRDLRTAVWNRVNIYLVPPFSWAAYAGLRLWAPVFLKTGIDSIRPVDHAADIPATVPVTVFASLDDTWATLAESQDIVSKMGSHARLVTVHGGQHGMLAANQHDQYLREIFNVIDRAATGGGNWSAGTAISAKPYR